MLKPIIMLVSKEMTKRKKRTKHVRIKIPAYSKATKVHERKKMLNVYKGLKINRMSKLIESNVFLGKMSCLASPN